MILLDTILVFDHQVTISNIRYYVYIQSWLASRKFWQAHQTMFASSYVANPASNYLIMYF